MDKKADIGAFNSLHDTSAYARPIEDFGETEVSQDHLDNLLVLEQMIITKRRYLAQDVRAYPVVYQARLMDIAKSQSHLNLLRQAIEEERHLRASSGDGS